MKFQDILFYYWALSLKTKRKDAIYPIIAEEKLKRINKYIENRDD